MAPRARPSAATGTNNQTADPPSASPSDKWNGDQLHRASWFNTMIKEAQDVFKYKSLILSGTAPISNRGQVAVYSTDHAIEHARRLNLGTWNKPSARRRTNSVNPASARVMPSTPAKTPAEGPLPAETAAPSRPTVSAALTTAIGDLADTYRVAPDHLEEAQLDLLNFFLDNISNAQVRKNYKKQAKDNGCDFIDLLVAEIEDDEVSMTCETTVLTHMENIISSGLSEATWDCYTTVTGLHEEWNETLDSNSILTDVKRAHLYRKMLNKLGPEVRSELTAEISRRVAVQAAKGKDIAKTDPLGLLNSAASVVLNDIQNEEIEKNIHAGRAFNATGNFDARKTSNPGGQTWQSNGPTAWANDMRPCALCPDSIPDSGKRHLDAQCKNVPKATVDAHIAEVAKRKEDRRKQKGKGKDKGKSGGAHVNRGQSNEGSACDTDNVFGDNALVDLKSLLDLDSEPKAGHALVARPKVSPPVPASIAANECNESTSSGPTASTKSFPDPLGSTPKFFVFLGRPDVNPDDSDSDSEVVAGIYYGEWRHEVMPMIREAFDNNLDKASIKKFTRGATDLEGALDACDKHQLFPTFHGPMEIEGLPLGGDVRQFLFPSQSDVSTPDHSDDDDSSDPELGSESDEPELQSEQLLDELVTEVESLTVEAPLVQLTNLIREHSLPVSPGIGGKKARTKFQMLQDIRRAVGCSPLSSPDTATQPPMGIPVDPPSPSPPAPSPAATTPPVPTPNIAKQRCDRLERAAQQQAATRKRIADRKQIERAANSAARTVSLFRVLKCLTAFLIPVAIMGLATLVVSPDCPSMLPESSCFTLERRSAPGAPMLPGTDAVPKDPGAPQVKRPPPLLDVAAIFLPMVSIAVYILASFFGFTQAKRPCRRGGRRPSASSVRHSLLSREPGSSAEFRMLMYETAPPWLMAAIVAHDTLRYVIPHLAAITTAFAVLQTANGVTSVWRSRYLSPVRFLSQFAANLLYLSLCLGWIVATLLLPPDPVWPPDLRSRGGIAPGEWVKHSFKRLRCASSAAFSRLCSLPCSTAATVFHFGGEVFSAWSTKMKEPTTTRPTAPDHDVRKNNAPRALHAFNPQKCSPRRLTRLQRRVAPTRTDTAPTAKHGRALLNRPRNSTGTEPMKSAPMNISSLAKAIIFAIVDSGCSWHCHPHAQDLINTRPCRDTMAGTDGKAKPCTLIGDLPIVARDRQGVWRKLLLRNVRCVPAFKETLVSVDQLWEDSRVDTVFNDVRCIVLPANGDGPDIDIPFARRENLYQFAILPLLRHSPSAGDHFDRDTGRALKTTLHRPRSVDHVSALPPDEALALIHRRLHVGFDLIRRLSSFAADVPQNIRTGRAESCEHCKEANATHLPHSSSAYAPSHVGRLIHADIVGPFRRSTCGFTYMLVLIDDHSRFKAVYFLKRKSDAKEKVRNFVAKLNALASLTKPEPYRVVGHLHCDNAGEFLSRDFKEFLDDELVEQTTCPPHVHQLNGVAERAIRSVVEVMRATRVASQCPIGFWPQLAEHAVDVLNRTTGPPQPHEEMSSYEAITGLKPKIMSIMPFGCRMYAVKPRSAYSKTEMESKAWVGINVGRSTLSPGAFNVWVPATGRTVTTSEVYCDEGLFPWRPAGNQRQGPSTPSVPPVEGDGDSANLVTNAATAASTPPPPAESLEQAYSSATTGAGATAHRSLSVLLIFSSSCGCPDGLAQFARLFGLNPCMFDLDALDLTTEKVYTDLRTRIVRGDFVAIFAIPPCATFSVSRFVYGDTTSDGGPPPVRTRSEINGRSDVQPRHRRELDHANATVAKLAALLLLAHRAGTHFIVEGLADRGDLAAPSRFLNERHGPLWLTPAMCALRTHTSAKQVSFVQSAFGANAFRQSTLLFTSAFDTTLGSLDGQGQGAREKPKTSAQWRSLETAPFPPDLSYLLAKSLAGVARLAPSEVEPKANEPSVASAPLPADSAPDEPEIGVPLSTSPAPPPDSSPSVSPARATEGSPRKLAFDNSSTAAKPTSDVDAAGEKRERKKVAFDKTAGARATRSQRPTVIRGLGTSAGYALLVLGATVGQAVYGMGTIDLAAELARPDSTLGSALLAKPNANDPKSQAEAYSRDKPGWSKSELKEMHNHTSNGTWEYIDRNAVPRGRNLIKLVWVYKTKRDGSLKSRLCVQGCRQVAGIDYDQTWCGSMRGTSLRLMSQLAASRNMRMRRWDFVAAYLQGELLEGEVVYCLCPPGYAHKGADGRDQVCKIVKPVYGMAQAGRRWQRSLFPWLKEYGFTQCHADSCVFELTRTQSTPTGPREEKLILGCYVDDLSILYEFDDSNSLYHDFTSALSKRWDVEDEGDLTDLLGIEFTRDAGSICLGQKAYFNKLAADFFPDGVPSHMQANRPPCDSSLPLHVANALSADKSDAPDLALLKRYQSLVGALLYASTNTRPDVAFSVGMLCRAMARPTPELMEDALRVLGYLYRTRDLGLRYDPSPSALEGMSDSDWAIKHSISGYVFSFGSACVSWASKKQASVALSSCEAEIMAGSEAAKEAIYLSNFLRELGFGASLLPADGTVTLRMDNKAAIDLSYNPEHHARTKHIDRRHYFIRECVEEGKLRVPFVSTVDNMADFFTKPLPAKTFYFMRDKIMNVPRAKPTVADCASCGDTGFVKGEPCRACNPDSE